MIDMMDNGAMRARFAALGEAREAALVVSTPLREERDVITQECQQRIAVLDGGIAEAEADLFDLDQERALIARALGGRTGATIAED